MSALPSALHYRASDGDGKHRGVLPTLLAGVKQCVVFKMSPRDRPRHGRTRIVHPEKNSLGCREGPSAVFHAVLDAGFGAGREEACGKKEAYGERPPHPALSQTGD
jgi:hypothetical protein